MFEINLQMFGGRGGSASGKGGSVIKMPKFTAKEVKTMNRKDLLTVAKAVYINKNTGGGLSASAAARRFEMIAGGNTVAQLRKYINTRIVALLCGLDQL